MLHGSAGAAPGVLPEQEAIFDAIPGMFYLLDATPAIVRWNREFEHTLGYSAHELVSMDPLLLVYQPEREDMSARLAAAFAAGGESSAEVTLVSKSGRRFQRFFTSRMVVLEGRYYLTGLGVDISDRKRIERYHQMEYDVTRALAEAEDPAEALPRVHALICEATGIRVGVYYRFDRAAGALVCEEIWNAPGWAHPAFPAVMKGRVFRAGDGVAGRAWQSGAPIWIDDVGGDASLFECGPAVADGLHTALAFPVQVATRLGGAFAFFSDEARPRDEQLLNILVSIAAQITGSFRRTAAERQLRFVATHDPLTKLPNRALFDETMRHSLARAERNHNRLAVLFVDIDRFKNINDTLGHDAGDRLLQTMARRIADCVRDGDTAARFGGDEFVVLIDEPVETGAVADVAQRLLETISKPAMIDRHEVHLTASIGISLYPDDAADGQALIKNADIAMYRAKDRGKNNFQFFSHATNVYTLERLAIESELRRALERDQFVLHYQPIVEAGSGRICGAEALLRWARPDGGLWLPERFISLAEETGLIEPIGEWVLRSACLQAGRWNAGASGPPLRVAVNLSARQFRQPTFVQTVERILAESDIPGTLIELEITESMVMPDPEAAVIVLTALKAMGLRIAIDDFGTGYSSLAYLKRFPVDSLKIDRSFIRDIPHSEGDVAITTAIVAMAKSLALTVVAEGVETAQQAAFLRELGCSHMQGFYCGSPALVLPLPGAILPTGSGA